ncbi:MAG: hypothetical protein IKE73_04985 [Bacilli bacterium]|nr:hypothetical protein [Bacilli bacterium]
MKEGQIANKKVITTFISSLCFLLVLYCTLSQFKLNSNEINTSTLKASVYDAQNKIKEENVLDTNESLSKESGLVEINYVDMGSYGLVALQYSAEYNVSSAPLTPARGALYFDGHKETYYSENVLPGQGLNIPGRHVADDGTIRDGDGFISVAADLSYLPRGTIVMTSLGPAKVYDTGCAYGTIDIYVSW